MDPARPSRRFARPALVLEALLLVLGGCRSLAPAPGAPVESWQERCAALSRLPVFRVTGRMAASAGNQGFSAAVQWEQRGDQARAQLRGPLGLGTVSLELSGDEMRLRDAEGNLLDASALGLPAPGAAVRSWLLACPASGSAGATGSDATPAALDEAGWHVEYSSYSRVGAHQMPMRIRATREDARLQLAISRWQLR